MPVPETRIAEISNFVDQEVELRGWLYNKRSSGKLHFLQIRDGSGIIQAVVFKGDVSPEVFAQADHLGQETSLKVRGTVRQDKRSPLGYELSVKQLEVVQEARDYPITPKEHGVAYLMERRHLWLRSPRQALILRVRHSVERAIRDFFDQNGFTLVDSPIFTPAACEGTSTLFEVPYFDLGKAYLTQSGQLYMEAAAMALGAPGASASMGADIRGACRAPRSPLRHACWPQPTCTTLCARRGRTGPRSRPRTQRSSCAEKFDTPT